MRARTLLFLASASLAACSSTQSTVGTTDARSLSSARGSSHAPDSSSAPASSSATTDVVESPAQDRPVAFAKSVTFDTTSRNGRVYRIFVAEPVRPAPTSGMPVVYVLDANAVFASVAEAARFRKNLTPALVVGVGFPTDALLDAARRYREYTPHTPTERLRLSPNEPQVEPAGTGGEDEFLAFLEDELKPAIAARWAVDPERQSIVGHSLGGRFVLHALYTRPGTFRTYVASSPSIWWGDGSLLDDERTFASAPRDARSIDVVISAGQFEQELLPGTAPERAEFLTRARMVDNAREAAARLAAITPTIDVTFDAYAGLDHGSALFAAIQRGLSIALRAPASAGPAPTRALGTR